MPRNSLALSFLLFLSINTHQSYSQENHVFSDPLESVQVVGGQKKVAEITKDVAVNAGCTDTGKVFIQVLINEQGLIEKQKIMKSKSVKLDSLSVVVVHKLDYIPAKRNGKPYKSYFIIPLNFCCE